MAVDKNINILKHSNDLETGILINTGKTADGITGVKNTLTAGFKAISASNWVKSAKDSLTNAIKSPFNRIGSNIKTVLSNTSKSFSSAFNNVGQMFSGVKDAIIKNNLIARGLSNIKNFMTSPLKFLKERKKKKQEEQNKKYYEDFYKNWHKPSTIIHHLASVIADELKKVFDIKYIADCIASAIKNNKNKKSKNDVKDFASQTSKKDKPSPILEGIGTILKSIADTIKNVGNALTLLLNPIGIGFAIAIGILPLCATLFLIAYIMGDKFTELAHEFFEFLNVIYDKLMKDFGEPITNVINAISGVLTEYYGIIERIEKIANIILDKIIDFISSPAKIASKAVGVVADAVGSVKDAMGNLLKNNSITEDLELNTMLFRIYNEWTNTFFIPLKDNVDKIYNLLSSKLDKPNFNTDSLILVDNTTRILDELTNHFSKSFDWNGLINTLNIVIKDFSTIFFESLKETISFLFHFKPNQNSTEITTNNIQNELAQANDISNTFTKAIDPLLDINRQIQYAIAGIANHLKENVIQIKTVSENNYSYGAKPSDGQNINVLTENTISTVNIAEKQIEFLDKKFTSQENCMKAINNNLIKYFGDVAKQEGSTVNDFGWDTL